METKRVLGRSVSRSIVTALVAVAILVPWIWQAASGGASTVGSLEAAKIAERAAFDRTLIDLAASERAVLTPLEERTAFDRALIDLAASERADRENNGN
jgi:hypothetical protein